MEPDFKRFFHWMAGFQSHFSGTCRPMAPLHPLLLTPLKNDGLRQLGWWHSQLNRTIKAMFQTTNQSIDLSYEQKGSPFWTPRCIPDLQLRQSISQQNAVLKSHVSRHVAPGLHMALNMWPPNLGLFEWGKWWSSNGFWDTQPVSVSFSIPKSSISFGHIGFPGSIPTKFWGQNRQKNHGSYGKSQVMDCKSWQPIYNIWLVVSQYPN